MVLGPSGADTPVRVGVVGVGIMGYNHARVLTDLPGAELVGIADPSQSQREKVAALLGCAAFASLDELVERGVDAVVIAAPTHLHHDISLAAIAAGKHVLVEKPIAPSVAEAEAIVAAAKAKGVALMVGHVERFNPAVESVKAAIRGEEIHTDNIAPVGPDIIALDTAQIKSGLNRYFGDAADPVAELIDKNLKAKGPVIQSRAVDIITTEISRHFSFGR